MTTLTIRNIPENLYECLKNQAEMHRRSLNSEIIYNLEQIVKRSNIDVNAIIKDARASRTKTSKLRLTQKKLNAAKNQGRL